MFRMAQLATSLADDRNDYELVRALHVISRTAVIHNSTNGRVEVSVDFRGLAD